MRTKRLLAITGLVLIAGMIFSINPVFAEVGKGTIQKTVYYNDVPLAGAYVQLWQDVYLLDDGYTDSDGIVDWESWSYGDYFLKVDYDHDGFWDTEHEDVAHNSALTVVENRYFPPETSAKQGLDLII